MLHDNALYKFNIGIDIVSEFDPSIECLASSTFAARSLMQMILNDFLWSPCIVKPVCDFILVVKITITVSHFLFDYHLHGRGRPNDDQTVRLPPHARRRTPDTILSILYSV